MGFPNIESAIREVDPGFFSGERPGVVQELLPHSATEWLAYATIRDRTRYLVEVPTSGLNPGLNPEAGGPRLRVVDANTGQAVAGPADAPSGEPATAPCTGPLDTISVDELNRCLKAAADELARRAASQPQPAG